MKVVYDISLLGRCFTNSASKTGLFRVIEEILKQLSQKSPQVELKVTGLCDPQPAFGSVRSSLYLKSNENNLPLHFINTYRSHLHLENFYYKIIELYNKPELLPKFRGSSRGIKGLLKLFSWIQNIDSYNVFDHSDFDVFHSPYFRLPPKSLTGNLPRILTIYDLIPLQNPEFSSKVIDSFFCQILKSIDQKNDLIICISEHTKQEFCEYTGMSPERVFVTYLAASEHFYPVRDLDIIDDVKTRYNIPQGEYFLTLASFQPRKNFTHLIRSFFAFLSENPCEELYLVLVGEKGWKYEEIFAAANLCKKFQSRVIFTGYIPDLDLSSIYSGAKGFIFPSLAEGFGLPVLEAMQCGVPVICSNTTSLPEVVADAAILVNPKEQDELCQAMLTLLQDNLLCQALSKKGLERAKNFSWEKCAKETVLVYQNAINK